ncbi:Uncharacterized protein Mb2734 [Camellia lanceoleosa]|uniref:Uncharacterized protein Mb2734 n=1 Tax=Camellia lanceoleosa TaxID=1840588 RepID=A0ACC0GED7_9ERIC|nr:Uncharacterized protein Mb2734 [Camellia lanceoleosa]
MTSQLPIHPSIMDLFQFDCKKWFHDLLSVYLSIKIATSQFIELGLSHMNRFPFIVTIVDAMISLYYRTCGLSPCTVDLDDHTTMHYWTANHRKFNKPVLVLIHGYGSTSTWQFICQVGQLSESFNLFIPDLLFFGKSYSKRSDRAVEFQAVCVGQGLKRLGVERFSVYALSYGGWVGYQMAHIYPEMVEKLVIVSSGIGFTEAQKREHPIGRKWTDMLCPEKPDDMRFLAAMAIHKYTISKWIPDFFLREFLIVMFKNYKKERLELVEYLLAKKADSDLPILTQETLLISGDKDNIFPLCLGHQLQRHLGPKSKLKIIKDTGHAANVESPHLLNDLIKSFVLGSPKVDF